MTAIKRVVVGGLVLPLAALAAGCGSSSTSSSSGGGTSTKVYKIYLSNSYLGEGYRAQMQKAAQAAVTRSPMKGRVDLKIVLSDQNTAASQISSLQNMILQKPDAIVIDPANGPALVPVIQRACAAGIKIVVFDSAVDAGCNTSVQPDWTALGKAQGDWMGKTLKGTGKIAIDTGLAGVPLSGELTDGVKAALQAYPNIQIVSTFESQFAPGPEQQGVAGAMASHPDLAGVIVDGAGAGAFNAFSSAGKVLPLAAFSYNGMLVKCAQVSGAQCYAGSAPDYQSAQAIYDAFNELNGGATPPKVGTVAGSCFQNNGISPLSLTCDKIELGKNAFADQPFDLTLPISPPWANPPFTVTEVNTAL
jgi:ribose transport system substrate-binding protein